VPAEQLVEIVGERARIHDADKAGTPEGEFLRASVANRAQSLIADWCEIIRITGKEGIGLSYQRFEDKAEGDCLLRDFLDPALSEKPPVFARFRANRSMREVEPAVDIIIEKSQNGTNQ
jgi:hypothetical protein